jgi:hypothetical protein
MVGFSRRKHTKHIDKKLRNRLRLYAVISVILSGIVIYDIFVGIVSFFFALIGITVGAALGIVSSRMYHLSWDHDAKKVISRMDIFGIIILVLYIISALLRRIVIEQFVHGPAVWGVTFALATGIMIGRVVGMRGKIIRVLQEQDVF